jgi:molecular chaperone Hsp33
VRAIVATSLVAEAARRHQTSPLATLALGRALMGALLLAAGTKDRERVQLSFEGVGALRRITAIGTSEGDARGFVSHPDVGTDDPNLGLDLGKAVAGGTLSVVRSRESWKEPYTGIVVLESGEIAEDIARYLADSEQVPSAIALGVYLGPDASVQAAAGFLAQALPGAEDDEISVLEENAGGLPNPSALVRDGSSAEELCGILLEGLGQRAFQSSSVHFRCDCSVDRARRSASLLGTEDIRELREKNERVEIRCAFCADVYHVSADEIEEASQRQGDDRR